MTAGARNSHPPRVLVGYDGSAGAANAVEIGARLLPDLARTWCTCGRRRSLARSCVGDWCELRPASMS